MFLLMLSVMLCTEKWCLNTLRSLQLYVEKWVAWCCKNQIQYMQYMNIQKQDSMLTISWKPHNKGSVGRNSTALGSTWQ